MKVSTLLAALPVAMAAPAKRSFPAPVLVPRDAQLIEGKYIVKMKTDARLASVPSAISSIAADADHTYSQFFHGFAASLTADELAKLRSDPNVDYIEQDAVVTITDTQEDAGWGLARLSSQKPNSTTYTYDSSAGEGTCAFVIDTGVEADHPEFEGRAKFLKNFAGDGDDTDGNGHGTHVSGTIGSKTYGVAKKTKIFGVKVLDADGSGSNSAVIAGMDYVAKEAKNQTCPKGVVVNMSLGGEKSAAVNDAAKGITTAGLFLAVAAGNDGEDASAYSPASEPSACTVGATTKSDALAKYSNTGSIVDVLAPGSDILSTWIGGKTNTISGTSMASPHVAGIGAYFLGKGTPAAGLCQFIVDKGLKNVITGVSGSTPNVLINNGEGGGGGGGGGNSTVRF
ncbi:subtilisin-like protease [Metarhizium album ARSEF 1941]|uniref:Subtilisin-like protease n=1 Tax=Metarhizium album (strain ARSEF 1941) TaxID=1081103 RepID=A0A0B2WY86_METAS|nr:subtilisin-like protease [Metarhizium album ARSEF 1941]KHN98377.1 subtilisin-like protease [Metarhizium album ARSEF 1941]